MAIEGLKRALVIAYKIEEDLRNCAISYEKDYPGDPRGYLMNAASGARDVAKAIENELRDE